MSGDYQVFDLWRHKKKIRGTARFPLPDVTYEARP